jgi:DedD protein
MFKSRSASQGSAAASAVPSVETLRRRARHRLIGASVLVLIGVVGFPLLFDTAPRPLTSDVSIDIPARSTPAQAALQPAAVAAAQQVPIDEALDDRESVAASGSPAPAAPVEPQTPAPQPVSKTPPASAPSPAVVKVEPSAPEPQKKADEGTVRVIVQVGAFADARRAREVRLKLERAGLKTYTHVAETAEGQRIRVRLGPFSSRAEAEKVAARARELGLPAAILTL